LIIKKRFDKALEHIDILLSKNNENGIYYNLKGHVLLWQGQYAPALSCFKKTYSLVRKKSSVILNTSVALSLSGCHGKAEELLLHAIKQYPKNIIFYFVIIENSMRAGEKNKAIGFNEKMFEQFNEREIEQGLDIFTNNPQYAPISKEIIAPVILNSGNQYL
jgi:tetratricopeptide (TPR) repeat protein